MPGVIKKLFGHDLAGPQRVNNSIQEYFRDDQIFRTDHYRANETVILDCLIGDHTLFVRQGGVELSWSFLSPILEACETCENRRQSLHLYKAGAWGPAKVEELMNRDGRTWHAAWGG